MKDPLGLWRLATVDPKVVGAQSRRTRLLFTITGASVAVMIMLTPVALEQFFREAFRAGWMSWVAAILFSLVLLNIYRMTMVTLGAQVLPVARSGRSFPIFSIAVRMAFLTGFAVFLSAPLATVLFKESGAAFVEARRGTERSGLQALLEERQAAWRAQDPELTRNGRDPVPASIRAQRGQEELVIRAHLARVEQERFFIDRIRHTYRTEPLALLVTVGLVLLFILPVLLKRWACHQQDMLAAMRGMEQGLVQREYMRAQLDLHSIWAQHLAADGPYAGVDFELRRTWEMHQGELPKDGPFVDPPFNTVRKEREQQASWEDFKRWFSGR